jgi:DNA repair protein RecO (recombination protein O)
VHEIKTETMQRLYRKIQMKTRNDYIAISCCVVACNDATIQRLDKHKAIHFSATPISKSGLLLLILRPGQRPFLFMVHKTQGIILRTVKYGETSLICTVFTELLGMQSYMIKGVRSAKSRSRKANTLFPASILDMVVYEQPQKNLQAIKEYTAAVFYQSLHEDVVKNGVALFAIEAVAQLLAAHDPQPELFSFLKSYLIRLDEAPRPAIANYPLYFLIQSAKLSGYYLSGEYSEQYHHADVHEGHFSQNMAQYPPFISGEEARLMSDLNKAASFEAVAAVKMTGEERKKMLQYFLTFLQLHVPHFRELRSLSIITAILY